jgi:methanogenic corrinoid protein MtbC1/DNA-binding XRE family transcriptional regulator
MNRTTFKKAQIPTTAKDRNRRQSERYDDPQQWQPRYARALLDGSAQLASQIVDEFLAARHSIAEIYLHLIAPAMAQIGDSWCRGATTVGSEHLATQVVLEQMDRLRSLQAPEHRHAAYRMLLACVEGEEHFIGVRMMADLCSANGWSVEFLGPNTPTDDLIDLTKRRRPTLVALSATMGQGMDRVHGVLEGFAKLAEIPKVLLGGQAFTNIRSLSIQKVNCRVATDILNGIELTKALIQQDRPKAVLREYLLALGRRIRELRNQKAWTQEQLADASRVTRVCIVAVEGGKQNVTLDIVVRIANALEIPPERLLTSEDKILPVQGRIT